MNTIRTILADFLAALGATALARWIRPDGGGGPGNVVKGGGGPGNVEK